MKSKISKKVLAFLLSAVMVLGMCVVPATGKVFAADEVQLVATVDKKEVKRGDTVTLTMSLANGKDRVYGLQCAVYFDKEVLEPITSDPKNPEVQYGNSVPAGSLNAAGFKHENSVNIMSLHMTDVYKDGVIFTTKFKVKQDAKAGSFGFETKDGPDDNLLTDLDANEVPCITMNQAADMNMTVPATGISLKSSTTIAQGAQEKLTAELVPADSDSAITWESDNTKVATVSEDGTVTGVSTGSAKITATANGKSAVCTVTVTNPLQSIEIVSKDGIDTLKKGQTLQLSVVYKPEGSTGNKSVQWSSSAPDVAEVDQNGMVTALKDGKTTITAAVGAIKDTYEVTVQEIPLQGISLNKENTTIHRGTSEKLTVSYLPSDTTDDRTVSWKSSDTSKVTVDAAGNVTAAALGEAIITATVGNFTAECKVTVDAPLEAIKPETPKLEMQKGQTAEVKYTLVPADTTDTKDVTMTSSDENIVSVKEHTLTAKQAGTAEITLTGANHVTAKITVQVKEIPINGVTLSADKLTVEKGETRSLVAKINPENTTDADKTITWTSSDPSVVTVDPKTSESGGEVSVTATDKGGTAMITASTANGKTAQCEVKVLKRLESIELGADQEILRGNTRCLDVVFNPADTDDDKTLSWESSDTSVATIDAKSGMITALKAGTTTITAKTTATKEVISDSLVLTVKENHLNGELGKQIRFETMKDAVLKGQKVFMNDLLTLGALVEQNQITDDITVNWSVSDEKVAVIDQTGCLTGLKEGETTVKAQIRATDGSGNEIGIYEAEVLVAIKEIPLESIAFDKVITEMKVGETAKLGILYNPANTTDLRNVEWSTSNKDILMVEQGVLTAKKPGTAVITAKVGEKSISCKITVKENQVSGGQSHKNPANNNGGAAKTGDAAPAAFSFALMLLAGTTAGILLFFRRRRHF